MKITIVLVVNLILLSFPYTMSLTSQHDYKYHNTQFKIFNNFN